LRLSLRNGVTDVLPCKQRDHARIKELSDRLIEGINSQVEHVVRNGDPDGYPGCVNLSFSYVEGESLLMALKASGKFTDTFK
jgi:cysteine sulfinate desulfinase/cysteine desulfurase-like protein